MTNGFKDITAPPSAIISNMKTTPKHNWRKNVLIVIPILILAIVGALLYRHQQTKAAQERAYQADKAKFAQVEADMSKVYAQLVTKLGTPDKQEVTKSCSHVNLKFKEGDLWCGVYYQFGYKEKRASDISDNEKLIDEAVSGSATRIVVGQSKLIDRGDNVFSIRLNRAEIEKCSIEIYNEKSIGGIEFGSSNGLKASYLFLCRNRVERNIYTLAE